MSKFKICIFSTKKIAYFLIARSFKMVKIIFFVCLYVPEDTVHKMRGVKNITKNPSYMGRQVSMVTTSFINFAKCGLK